MIWGTSLAAQWLRLRASTAWGMGLIPGQCGQTTTTTKLVIWFHYRSLQHHQDLILMPQGKNYRNLEKEKGLWQRKNSQRWNRSWKRMWFLFLIVLILMPFLFCLCFCFFALWYPILSIISPHWPFLEDTGLSRTTSVNDHDQSLQENYRIIVCTVKFFKLQFYIDSENWKRRIQKFIKNSRKGNNDFLKHSVNRFIFYLQGLSYYLPGSLFLTSAYYQDFYFS